MLTFLNEIHFFTLYFSEFVHTWEFYMFFVPIVLFVEFPLYFLVLMGMLKILTNNIFNPEFTPNYHPKVSCIVTCYNEGDSVIRTIKSLLHQIYYGIIEVIVVIDGADINIETLKAASNYKRKFSIPVDRILKILPKSSRGGHASSENLGVKMAEGDIVIILDGDCSCDNNMVEAVVQNFKNKNVAGVSGSIKVRNYKCNLLTRLQALEYIIGLHLSRIGLGNIGMLNNISGAFGIFRKDIIEAVGGWKNGTAEDLDLTMRLKAYEKRYKGFKLVHDHTAIVHTDVPETWKGYFKQRLRWEGDLYYVYFRRHLKSTLPKYMGWKNIFGIYWYNIFFCAAVPLITAGYMIFLLFEFNISFVVALLLITYFYYLIVTSFMFIIYILLACDRKKSDIKLALIIPIMPLYQFVGRLWTAFSLLAEIFLKTHKNSNMAPWWVIKKTL